MTKWKQSANGENEEKMVSALNCQKAQKNGRKLPLKQLKREDMCFLTFTLRSPELLLALFA